jgi:hypothetical protein
MRAVQQLVFYDGRLLCPEHGSANMVPMHIEGVRSFKFGYICLSRKDAAVDPCGKSAEWKTEAEMLRELGIGTSLSRL